MCRPSTCAVSLKVLPLVRAAWANYGASYATAQCKFKIPNLEMWIKYILSKVGIVHFTVLFWTGVKQI